MRIQITPIIYDDNNVQCRVGDKLLIQTRYMQDLSVGTILEIYGTSMHLQFEDARIGYKPITIRTSDVISCTKYS